jgi:hypothetical protein
MKLGIAVVYMVAPQQRRLLDIHLDFVARNTTVPYVIYGAVNRLPDELRTVLRANGNVRQLELAETTFESGQQHAADLDELLRHAAEDGATHLATLHVDSWPVRPDWPQWIDARLSDRCVLAGVLRSENGDRLLPSTCGVLFRREFYEKYQPRFLLTDEQLRSPEIRRFQRAIPQATDSGLSLGHLIWSRDLDWVPLQRSNRHNDHYLLCGVYGDLFFHLGAAAREKHFQGDFAGAGASARRRLVKSLKHWVKHRAPPALSRLYTRMRPRPREWQGQILRNQRTYEDLRGKLFADPDGYIAQLRFGQSSNRPADLGRGTPEARIVN